MDIKVEVPDVTLTVIVEDKTIGTMSALFCGEKIMFNPSDNLKKALSYEQMKDLKNNIASRLGDRWSNTEIELEG